MRTSRVLRHVRNNLIGYVALFIALTGTAYAVDGSLPGTNTVGSADIINGEVKTPDVGARQIGTDQVAVDSSQRALTGANVAPNALNASDIVESSVEPDAFGRYHDAAQPVSPASGIGGNPRAGDEDVLALDLPAGNYFIVAKGQYQRGEGSGFTCILYADGDTDTLDLLNPTGTFTMSVLAGGTAPFTVHLACTSHLSNPQCFGCNQMQDLKINAVEVRGITNSSG